MIELLIRLTNNLIKLLSREKFNNLYRRNKMNEKVKNVKVSRAYMWCFKNVRSRYPEIWQRLEDWDYHEEMYFITEGDVKKILAGSHELEINNIE